MIILLLFLQKQNLKGFWNTSRREENKRVLDLIGFRVPGLGFRVSG
jgi:hypothetical protein